MLINVISDDAVGWGAGRGIKGVVIPGCPETYQESQQSEFPDQHQKIRHVRARELFAVPAGATHWTFNDGNERLVATVLLDVSNNANQLDSHPRVTLTILLSHYDIQFRP